MKNPICVAGSSFLILCLMASAIQAAEPEASRFPQLSPQTACHGPLGTCWDDYCRKPLPPAPCSIGLWAGEHYCRKPLPGVQSWAGHAGCDTYHRKPWPALTWPATPGTRRVATGLHARADFWPTVGPSKSLRDPDPSAISIASPAAPVSPAAAAHTGTRPGSVSPPDFSSRRRIASEPGGVGRHLR